MNVSIIDKKVSATGKRIDAVIKKTAFLSRDRFLKVRILAYEDTLPKEDYEIEALFEKVVANERKWKECKKSCSLRLPEVNATAFILDKDYKIKANEDTE